MSVSRKDDGVKRAGGVNYNVVIDRPVVDKRFERERANAGKAIAPANSTIDTLQRLAAGIEGRTIADKINDANRPTWEQYKKDNESKLDMVGGEVRKMVEYRAQLDKERDDRLAHGTNRAKKSNAISDSDDDSSSDDSSDSGSKRKRKHKKDKKKSKKSKKHKDKKEKKHKRSKHSSSDTEEGSDGDEERKDKKERKKRRKSDSADKESNSKGSYRLSDFMKGGYSDDEDI